MVPYRTESSKLSTLISTESKLMKGLHSSFFLVMQGGALQEFISCLLPVPSILWLNAGIPYEL